MVYSDLLRNPDYYEGRVVNYRGVVSGAINMMDSQYFNIVENPIFLGLPVGGIHGVGYMEKTPVSQAWWWTDPLAHMRRCDESYWIRRFERLGLNGAIRATV